MKRRFSFVYNGEEIEVAAERRGEVIEIERDGQVYTVELVSGRGGVKGDAEPASSGSDEDTGSAGPAKPSGAVPARSSSPAAEGVTGGSATSGAATGSGSGTTSGEGQVPAPMTGVIKEVLVSIGDAVAEGGKVMIMEAMKMDIEVSAYHGGTVKELYASAGDNVKEGQSLVKIG